MQRAEIKILKLTPKTPESVFTELSEISREYLGREGWSENSFRAETEKENGIVLYCTCSDVVIGYISGYTAVGEADITGIAMSENFRKRGLADKLIGEFESLLPPDTESIFLEVRKSNAPAVNLYGKNKFFETAVRKNFYSEPDEDAVVMKKIIIK